ncbi:MAG: hypothetical protein H6926_00555 [Chromatiales bacterium]|nr:hypothetical protein [Gammaproteobacteria bacterium]MCP5351670.1 hypothetical protein [Chromatiales bacterium]
MSLGLSTLLNGPHRLVELTGAAKAPIVRAWPDGAEVFLDRAGQADMEPVIIAGAAPRLWRIYICNSLIKR